MLLACVFDRAPAAVLVGKPAINIFAGHLSGRFLHLGVPAILVNVSFCFQHSCKSSSLQTPHCDIDKINLAQHQSLVFAPRSFSSFLAQGISLLWCKFLSPLI